LEDFPCFILIHGVNKLLARGSGTFLEL
jgi:hypothetical protein